MSSVAYAWVRASLADAWHLVRGLTPVAASAQTVVAPCGATFEVTYATDRPAGAAPSSKVCRPCHEAAVEYGLARGSRKPS